MSKWLRTYSLQVEGQSQTHTVTDPLTVDFDIDRSMRHATNNGHFTLYNLAQSTRRDIFQDRIDTGKYRKMTFKAGYVNEPALSVAFQGNIYQAFSFRRGPDWITQIEAYDGGFAIANSPVELTLGDGWKLKDAIRDVASALKNVTIGVVGDFVQTNPRGRVLAGDAWQILQQLVEAVDGRVFIDNEKFNALQLNEYIASNIGVPLINSATGLLNTPRRLDNTIEIETLFEPRAAVGQRVQVQSLEAVNNGLYQLIGVRHKGTISGAVCGRAVTTLQAFLGVGVPAGIL